MRAERRVYIGIVLIKFFGVIIKPKQTLKKLHFLHISISRIYIYIYIITYILVHHVIAAGKDPLWEKGVEAAVPNTKVQHHFKYILTLNKLIRTCHDFTSPPLSRTSLCRGSLALRTSLATAIVYFRRVSL